MRKNEESPRFGPGIWATLRDTGEHVKVEFWSPLAGAYRVYSRKNGVRLVGEDELDALAAHPEEHLGKFWRRCPAPGCGAPLTPGLEECAQCHAPTCTCGRCACPPRARSRTKAAPKSRA
jgi:hypothetical protein